MHQQNNSQKLLESLNKFVDEYQKDNSSKAKSMILELAPAIKNACKKGISKKQVFDCLKANGLTLSYSTFVKWIVNLNLYTKKAKKVKKLSDKI